MIRGEGVRVTPPGRGRLVVEPCGVLGRLVESPAVSVDEVAVLVVKVGRVRWRVALPVVGPAVGVVVRVAGPAGRVSVAPGVGVVVRVGVRRVGPVTGPGQRRGAPAVGDSSADLDGAVDAERRNCSNL
jgi:hypothetical protein